MHSSLPRWMSVACPALCGMEGLKMCQQLPGRPRTFCLRTALAEGSKKLEMIQWMLSHDDEVMFRWEPYMAVNALPPGDMPILQWLHSAGYALDPCCAYFAAQEGHTVLLSWLLDNAIHPSEPSCGVGPPWPAPFLMLSGQHGLPLHTNLQQQPKLAPASFCMFYGLVRWCWNGPPQAGRRRHGQAAPMPYPFCSRTSLGLQLLANLAKLPEDILTKIAVAANLKCDPSFAAARSSSA